MFWCYCKHIYIYMCWLSFIWSNLQGVQEEKARIEQRYVKLQETMRALQTELKTANFYGDKVCLYFTVKYCLKMGLSNSFVYSCCQFQFQLYFFAWMFQKFFPPLNSRSKKLRKTCTIYVNHHEGKIMSVFKTVHLFVQGQGQRAPGDGWWCASINLRRLFQV